MALNPLVGNVTLTIYTPVKDETTKLKSYARSIVTGAMWDMVSTDTSIKTGVDTKQKVLVVITDIKNYVDKPHWDTMSFADQLTKWTGYVSSWNTGVRVAKGDIDFEYTWANSDGIEEQNKVFNSIYHDYELGIKQFDEKFFGSKNMWHVELILGAE